MTTTLPAGADTESRNAVLVRDVLNRIPGLVAGDLPSMIDGVLGELGLHLQVDRCQLLLLADFGHYVRKVHEWRAPGMASNLELLKAFPCQRLTWWMGRLRNGRLLVIDKMDDVPQEASAEIEYLATLGLTSFLSVPLLAAESLIGFLNVCSLAQKRSWRDEEIEVVTGITNALATAMRFTRAESALQVNDSNMRGLLDNFEDFFFILDTAGRVLQFNKQAESRLGFPVEELRRMTAVELFGMDWHPGASPSLSDLLAGKGVTFRVTLATRGIGRIPVELKVTRGEWNRKTVLFAVCRDLTERHKAQEGLRQSEARTDAVLAAIPDAMLRLDRNGEILGFSPGDLPDACAMAREPGSELPRRIAGICQPHICEANESGEIQIFEFDLPLQGGTQTFEIRLSPMGDDETLAIVRDISERARLEQAKADFINRASHELRTPLTTSLLMADLIREGGEDEEIEEYWKILHLELHRQHELVEDLLTVGRLETGHLDMNFSLMGVADVLKEALSSLFRLADARKIRLVEDVIDGLPTILGDGLALRRVFYNLLDNAVKFSPAGGEVRLEARPGNEGVRIRISDSGIGIPADELSSLFDRFYRASNAVKSEIRGTGVGLFIVKTLIEAHGGTVNVTSALGEGTTFEIFLPAGAQD